MINLHFLLTDKPAVIANMRKLLHAQDAVVLLDEACRISIKELDAIKVYSRSATNHSGAERINDTQWLALCDRAQLIHSWY